MNNVGSQEYLDGSGRVEARYLAFLETVSTLRPSLHRYCARTDLLYVPGCARGDALL